MSEISAALASGVRLGEKVAPAVSKQDEFSGRSKAAHTDLRLPKKPGGKLDLAGGG